MNCVHNEINRKMRKNIQHKNITFQCHSEQRASTEVMSQSSKASCGLIDTRLTEVGMNVELNSCQSLPAVKLKLSEVLCSFTDTKLSP